MLKSMKTTWNDQAIIFEHPERVFETHKVSVKMRRDEKLDSGTNEYSSIYSIQCLNLES